MQTLKLTGKIKQTMIQASRPGPKSAVVIAAFILLATAIVPLAWNKLIYPAYGFNSNIHKIKHIVIITQENRSFDSYFGTFPGADGIPRKNGVPTVCSPDPATGKCVKPFLDNSDHNQGGPHGLPAFNQDYNNGKMNGFEGAVHHANAGCNAATATATGATDDPADAALSQVNCAGGGNTDVMGYHNGQSLQNYWSYARNFALDDHFYASSESWSLPEHLYLISEWSASCSKHANPASCVNALQGPESPPDFTIASQNVIHACNNGASKDRCVQMLGRYGLSKTLTTRLAEIIRRQCFLGNSYVRSSDYYNPITFNTCENALNNAKLPADVKQKLTSIAAYLQPPDYAWTDLTYLLHKQNVSWRYYVMNGTEPDCQNDSAVSCPGVQQNAHTPGIWNPLPYFDTVRQDNQLGNIQSLTNFYTAARRGNLASVSWIVPSFQLSEHPPASVSAGQAYVTGLINTIAKGPDWKSTAVFVNWDDWGGFYDHVKPPKVDQNGYGFRVPGLVISAYAKHGYIDHQTLSQDAYVKFIEDDFLGGARLNPKTDGRPDPRPSVRENQPQLGNLMDDFNFNQDPRRPFVLNGATTY